MNGLLAGTIASAVMSGAMRAAQALGALERPPPGTITERMLGTRGRSGSARNAVQNTAAHLAFGAVMGLVFDHRALTPPSCATRAAAPPRPRPAPCSRAR